MVMDAALTTMFLNEMYVDQDGYHLLFMKTKKEHTWSMWFKKPEELMEYLNTSRASYHNVYFSVGLSDAPLGSKHRARDENIIALPALWADIDIHGEVHRGKLPTSTDKAIELIEEAALPRLSMIVHSGHDINPYWLLTDPWVFTTAEERHAAHRVIDGLQQAIRTAALRHGWTLDIVSKISTTLRLPGTFNRRAKKEPVRLMWQTGLRYSRAEFEPLAALSTLPADLHQTSFSSPSPLLPIGIRREGGERVAEFYEPRPEQLTVAKALYADVRPDEPWPGLCEPVRCLRHDDGEYPDGRFIASAAGNVLFQCWHAPQASSLQALYATLVLNREPPSSDVELAKMRDQMYLKYNAVERPDVRCDPIPEGATELETRVYLDVIGCLEHNWVSFPGEPVMYTASFGAMRLDAHVQAVKEALIALRKQGVLRLVDKVSVGKYMGNRWLTEAEARRREAE
jgi:hypothetical protein